MVEIFLTVDTEVWQKNRHAPARRDLAQDMAAYIHGSTPEGAYGLAFQLDQLNKHGLYATFFVESLFASAVGLGPLREIVSLISSYGQEVQLHVHPEWLKEIHDSALPQERGQFLHAFGQEEQAGLIARAKRSLSDCGVRDVCAFRAGNFGANLDTLPALVENGILCDSSYNACYLDSSCQMRLPQVLLQPRRLRGVCEFPISFFVDRPGHCRHLQLTACSWAEMRHILLKAWKQNWHSLVILWHSFELIHIPRDTRPNAPDKTVISRFERMCRFLDQNREKFRTVTFSELGGALSEPDPRLRPLKSPVHLTVRRFGEQLARRLRWSISG